MSEDQRLVTGGQYLHGLYTVLYRAVRQRFFLMVVTMLVVAMIAYLVTPRGDPIYGAQATVQIGQVAGAAVMALPAAVARVGNPAFKRAVLQSMNLTAEDGRTLRVVSDGIAARPVTSDTMVINTRAFTEPQARQALEAVVQALNAEQEKVRKPAIADIQDQISEIDTDVADLSKIQEAIWPLVKPPVVAARGAESEINHPVDEQLFQVLSQNEQSLMAAKTTRRELTARLGGLKTFPTAIVDNEVLISQAPLSPSRSKIAFLAAGFTLVGFILYALMPRRRTSL